MSGQMRRFLRGVDLLRLVLRSSKRECRSLGRIEYNRVVGHDNNIVSVVLVEEDPIED